MNLRLIALLFAAAAGCGGAAALPPVYYTSFDLALEETIQPGATGTISNIYLPYFPGRVTRLRAFLQFE